MDDRRLSSSSRPGHYTVFRPFGLDRKVVHMQANDMKFPFWLISLEYHPNAKEFSVGFPIEGREDIIVVMTDSLATENVKRLLAEINGHCSEDLYLEYDFKGWVPVVDISPQSNGGRSAINLSFSMTPRTDRPNVRARGGGIPHSSDYPPSELARKRNKPRRDRTSSREPRW